LNCLKGQFSIRDHVTFEPSMTIHWLVMASKNQNKYNLTAQDNDEVDM